MEIVKKNLVSIILGAIAILAIVASFWPLGGYFGELQASVGQREAQFKKAKDLFTKRHTLPLTKLGPDAGTPKDLPVFPMPRITQDAKAFMDSLVSESKGVFAAAVELNKAECAVNPAAKDDPQRMLLVPGSLPSLPGAMGDQFKGRLPGEVERLRTQVLNGGFPPSQQEQAQAVADLQAQYDKKRIRDANGQAINEQEVADALNKVMATLAQDMRDRVALSHTMYVDPAAIILPTDFTTSPTPPSADRVFYAQAALWAEEDVCRAIAEVNASAPNVTAAPVKRLLHLDVAYGPAMYLRPMAEASAGGGAAGGETPYSMGMAMAQRYGGGAGAGFSTGAGGPNDKMPPLPSDKQDFTLTPTGRTCNGLYDVVNITLDVHVDATKIPALMAALNRNRLITVRNVQNFSRVDNADMLNQGFAYGAAPVADLILDLELLQMREWTAPLMPTAVKALLGADKYESQLNPPKTAGGAAATPAAPAPAAAPAAPAAHAPAIPPGAIPGQNGVPLPGPPVKPKGSILPE